MSEHTKFAHLGKPGTAFTAGFQRRLDLIKKYVDFSNKKVLDMGCGEGVWLEEFAKLSGFDNVYGSEYDNDQVVKLKEDLGKRKRENGDRQPSVVNPKNIVNCPGENLVFEDDFFDIVFHNEVLEHVQVDLKTLQECFRVLKKGGLMVFFTPNRLWPFEQHGMFLGGKYYWGNIPLLPWMPNIIYKKFAPHVRSYWGSELKNMIKKSTSNSEFVKYTQIFPGFDGAVRRLGLVGKLIQKTFLFLEKTPLHIFGISHFVIVRKL
ncbi:MAG: class I SAM-dependent methyltransferase [Candidatus Dojkabacteria bacterium]